MDLWFSEFHTPYVKFSIQIDKQLYSEQTEFQRIDILESKEFGRMMVLDGYVMLTEKDEFIYHEMIVHVPMAVHPNAKRILIIGGGDGGAARELMRYKNVESVDLVEIDKRVVDISREFLPKTFGPGEGLFTKEFYGNCYKALKEDGIMVNQHESPFYDEDAFAMQRAHQRIVKSFPISRVYQAHIPTYPSGHWLFGFASKKYHPTLDFDAKKWNDLKLKTRYYNANLHNASFALPNYVEELMEDVEEKH